MRILARYALNILCFPGRRWNSLPDLVTSAPSVAVFRSRLKTHLFTISYPLWLYSPCAVTLVALDTIIVLAYLLTNVKGQIERKILKSKNLQSFDLLGALEIRGYEKLRFYCKRHILAWIHVDWAILRENRLRGLTSRAVGEKTQKVTRGSHRNEVSPLTQGLRYRAACDEWVSEWVRMLIFGALK